MARIALKNEMDNDPQTQEIFNEIKGRVGFVPAAYRAFARHYHILQANWNKTRNILSEGNLPLETKEAIATRVSKVNGCHFCLLIHRANLGKLGVDAKTIDAIENGKTDDPKLSTVLDFVSTATKEPQNLSSSDFSKLKTFGFSEEDILEILTVMEMYTGYNKIIVALDLQPEE